MAATHRSNDQKFRHLLFLISLEISLSTYFTSQLPIAIPNPLPPAYPSESIFSLHEDDVLDLIFRFCFFCVSCTKRRISCLTSWFLVDYEDDCSSSLCGHKLWVYHDSRTFSNPYDFIIVASRSSVPLFINMLWYIFILCHRSSLRLWKSCTSWRIMNFT